MEGESSDVEENRGFLYSFNWFGLVSGVLFILLPFLGAWWNADVGGGSLEVSFSPFYYEVVFVGEKLTSTLVNYFILAAKLTAWIGGSFLAIGSLRPRSWWGKELFDWGRKKIFWMLIGFVAILVIGALVLNGFFYQIISRFVGSEVSGNLDLPYLLGEGSALLQIEDEATVKAPISFGLTPAFALAVSAAVLGFSAKIFDNRFIRR